MEKARIYNNPGFYLVKIALYPSSPDNTQQHCDNSDHEQNVDEPASYMKYEKAEHPANN
jgi:hypothetical protein